ncbi:F-box protein At4g00755-like [Cynara cardunculus var. scolymus]|uniref:F-box protein At4g00755-like n=1 Tax=Cynara cardunculus var. scolymus TaxID=59895 RepID=UPI000D62A2F5|nr:F-box protein At4g00755-like [Cynara cardunculus var. scolymus]
METRIDFVRWLDIDVVLKILMCLNDPADLIRASAVSQYWQKFVISYGLCKQLCTKTFPQLASITHVTEPSDNSDDPSGGTSEDSIFRREHRAYASLFQAVASFPARFCIASPVSASSTDNYPEESIVNTLDSRDQILVRASYWSSKGHDDPELPETLIYKLNANFCVITEINITPFEALFQVGSPIYSSRFVRFRMGHPKSSSDIDRDFLDSQEDANDKFVWTYTSQTFPMAQENRVQWFKLPEPVLCIGGFLQIELLGRVQKQRSDAKYYICVAHVQAIGCQLSPAFSVDISEPSNTISLEYNSKEFMRISQDPSALGTNLLPVQPPRGFIWENLQEFVDMIQLQQNVMEFAWINDDFEMDEFDPVALMM